MNPIKKKTLFRVSDEYINSLQDVDYRVQDNYHNERLYFKTDVGFKTEDGTNVNYYVPLSSYKEKQKNINNKTVFKIYESNTKQDDPLGVLHINNMIPVPDFETKEWSPNDRTNDQKYKNLVVKQANYLQKNENTINADTKLLYDCKTENVERDYFKKNRQSVLFYKSIVNEVKELEKVCLQHVKEHTLKQSNREYDMDL